MNFLFRILLWSIPVGLIAVVMTYTGPEVTPEDFEGPDHYYSAVTRALLDEAAKRQPDGGEVVLIRFEMKNPAIAKQAKSDIKKVFKDSTFTLAAEVSLDITDQAEEGGGLIRLDGETFTQILADHPDVPVFVSLVGEPVLSTSQKETLRDRDPVLVVLSEGGTSYWPDAKKLLKEGLIDAAVVRHLKPEDWDGSWDEEERMWFDRRYDVLEGGE